MRRRRGQGLQRVNWLESLNNPVCQGCGHGYGYGQLALHCVFGKEQTGRAWRTALDPHGDWIPAVLQAANTRLDQLRRAMPDAGGLVIATDQSTARDYAELLEEISGEKVTVVLSDDSGASTRIETFAADTSRWMVAVRMVSEGVDVPRLCVGVYATSTSTPLYFAQAVGRFVRARKRGETASVFLPSVPVILSHAAAFKPIATAR